MSALKMRLLCCCLVAGCALYASTVQAQALFSSIYPKWYEVDCSGTVCGSSSGTCSTAGPFFNLGSVGVMNFLISTSGNGSATVNISNGATVLLFPTAAFTFTAR